MNSTRMVKVVGMKHFVCKLLLASVLCLGVGSSAWAHTDDTGVLAGLESNPDIYGYLNMYHYSLFLADYRYGHHDMYISADKAVIVSLWGDRLQPDIFIVKPGYATNKGITLGMDRSDVERVYGPLFEDDEWGRPAEPYGDFYRGFDNYSGYYYGEYVGPNNTGLSFVFNQYTNKVVLIRYQYSRRSNSHVMSDVAAYHLLPMLR